jgi:hypothetical protein
VRGLNPDYKRNGTATLFAALNAANGEVYGYCQEQHVTRNGSSLYAGSTRSCPPISTYI